MKNILTTVICVSILVSCSTTRNGKPQAMWTYIPQKSEVSISVPTETYRMNPVFIDSLLHPMYKDKNPDMKVTLPLPTMDPYTILEYFFSEIYDTDRDKQGEVRGFIGEQKTNKNRLVSLYIDEGKVTAKWDREDTKLLLRYKRTDSIGDVYELLNLMPSNDLKRAPTPKYDK